jgi:hypothetical protein
MTDSASADIPIAIDRVDCTRSDRDGLEMRLTGRWLGGAEVSGSSELLLVVQVQGRRHRFTPARDDHPHSPGDWEATFRIPPWAQPRHEGQAALWVGTSVVPVPLPGASGAGAHPAHRPPASPAPLAPPSPPALGEARAWPSDVAPPPADFDPARFGDGPASAVDTGRTGPLAELLFKESVSALHAELEERSAEVARLQGAVAEARSELEARASRQSALESAHGDLRGELQELMAAVGAQSDDYERRLSQAEERAAAAEAERDRLAAAASGRQHHAAELSALRDQLAAAQVSRDAAAGEVAGLRTELERLGSELAITREHQSAQGGDLGEAQRLLAEARSLSEQLRSQSSH